MGVNSTMVPRLGPNIISVNNFLFFIYFFSFEEKRIVADICVHFVLLTRFYVNLNCCRHLCMVIFTGMMWKNRNGS
jgi:hypothetical protein